MKKKFTNLFTITVSSTLNLSALLVCSLMCASPVLAKVESVEISDIDVNEDIVVAKTRVKGSNQRPLIELKKENFEVYVDGAKIEIFRWKNPKNSTPPPARILILLDISGSMKGLDSRGTPKIHGAAEAILQIMKGVADQTRSVSSSDFDQGALLSVVPFGRPNPDINCKGAEVTAETIQLERADYPKSENVLDNYVEFWKDLCASTDLYKPIENAVRYLSDETNSEIYDQSGSSSARLAVIVLSDGYHTSSKEAQEFAELRTLLEEESNNITVHTLGYGKTPETLGKQCKLNKPISRSELEICRQRGVNPEEFVDRDRLREIAESTGGISEFAVDAEQVSESFQEFLSSILGQYEIEFTDPNPESGSNRELTVVVNDGEGEGIPDQKPYYMTVLGWPVSFPIRVITLLSTLAAIGLLGLLPFWYWGKSLIKNS